ncbi:MAG: DUF2207 domain-containing protein [Candidatus Gastranaerophilales bacterium]|nr:DUF2207 domain-containing protein [Candidatus Gastranaerophilales bacterium]
MIKKIIFVFIVALFLIFPSYANDFYIENYDVDVTVSKDNIYHIKEKIKVHFTHYPKEIQKTIPTKFIVQKKNGKNYTYSAKVRNFKTKNLVSEERKGNSIEFIIGYSNLDGGNSNYYFEYDYIPNNNTIKQNEFYLSLIGTTWNVPIYNIDFKIKMPKKIDSNLIDFSFVKYNKSNYKNNIIFSSDGYTITGHTLAKLPPRGIFEIRIPLPDNYFIIKFRAIELDNCMYFSIFSTLIVFILWFFYGKDEPIIPVVTTKPPRGLNSAQVAAIYNGDTFNYLSSLILYFASKGYIKITKGGLYLEKIKEYNEKDPITKKLYDRIFKYTRASVYALKYTLSDEIEFIDFMRSLNNLRKKIYYKNSISFTNYLAPSIFTIFNFIILIRSLGVNSLVSLMTLFMATYISFCTFVPLFALWVIVFSKYENIAMKIIITILWLPGIILLSHALVNFDLATYFTDSSFISFICLACSIVLTVNMPRKNLVGRKILGEILGFKKFIETAEKRKLEILINQNPNYINEITPYAHALGIDGILTEKILLLTHKLSKITPEYYYTIGKIEEASNKNPNNKK